MKLKKEAIKKIASFLYDGIFSFCGRSRSHIPDGDHPEYGSAGGQPVRVQVVCLKMSGHGCASFCQLLSVKYDLII